MGRRPSAAKPLALAGVTAALALALMCLAGLFPALAMAAPILPFLLLEQVRLACGSRIGWAWYGAVSLLWLVLGMDKESALLFLFLGYYPLVKPKMDKLPFCRVWKSLLFLASMLLLYGLLLRLLGLEEAAGAGSWLGTALAVGMLAVGTGCFLALDWVLDRMDRRRG